MNWPDNLPFHSPASTGPSAAEVAKQVGSIGLAGLGGAAATSVFLGLAGLAGVIAGSDYLQQAMGSKK